MRRSLLAVPVVLLGAGGFYLWHSSNAPPVEATVKHAPMPATITTGDGRVLPAPVTHVQPTAPIAAASGDGVTTPPTSPVANAPALPPAATTNGSATVSSSPVDPQRESYLRTHDRSNATTPKLAVPMPGLAKMQNTIGTQASCQGPDAAQHYAGLTGQERLDFAARCKRVGITLPR